MNLIIFDFDGVIADSLHYIHEVSTKLADKYGFKKVDTDEHYADIIQGNVFYMIKQLGIKTLDIPRIFLDYEKMMNEVVDKIHIYPGMLEVIQSISKDHSLAIVSSNHKSFILKVLERYNLTKEFDQVMGLELSFHKTKKFTHIINKLKPETVTFITDTLSDVIDAKNADIKNIIGVKWGFHTWSDKDKEQPDKLAENPRELLSLLY